MFNRLRKFISAPVFEDEDQTRVARFLYAVLLTALSSAMLYAVLALVSDLLLARLPIVLAGIIFFAVLFILTQRGRVELAGILFIAGSWIILTISVLADGGIPAPAFAGYILVIVSATFFSGGRAGLIATVICILSGAGIIYAQSQNVLPPPAHTPLTSYLVQSTVFLVAGTMLGFFHTDLKTALDTARRAAEEVQGAHESLRAGEEKYRSIIAAMVEGIVFQARDGSIITCNASAESILGLTQEQMMGRTSTDPRWRAIHEDGSPFPSGNHPSMVTLQTGKPCSNVIMGVHKPDGALTWISINSQPLFNAGESKPYAVVASFTDITERKEAQEALLQFRNVMDESNDAIFLIDPETSRYIDFNKRALDYLGYDREELMQMGVIDIAPRVTSMEVWRERVRMINEKRGLVFETVYRRKDGTILPVEVSVRVIMYGGMNIQVAVTRDISDRQRTEAAQLAIFEIAISAQSLGTLDELFTSIHQTLRRLMPVENFYIALFDAQSNLLSFPYFVDQHDEAPAPNKLGKGLTEYVLRMKQPLMATPDVFESLMKSREIEAVGTKPVDWLGAPLSVGDETFGIMVVQTYDEKIRLTRREMELLTYVAAQVATAIKRKQTEDKLASSEAYLRTIIESEPECVKVLAKDCALMDMNPAGLAMIEADSLDQVAGKSVLNLVMPDYREQFQALNRRVFAGESGTLEFEIEGIKGTRRWLETHAVPLFDPAAKVTSLLGLTRDITERKQAEAALREAEAKYRNLVERLPVVVYTSELGAQGRWSYVSPQIEPLLGFIPEEWMADPGLWYRQVHAEDRDQQEELEEQAWARGESFDSEYRISTRAGNVIWIRDTAQILPSGNNGAPIVQGTLMDVTERRQARERLKLFFNQSLDGFFFSMLEEPKEWSNSVDKEKVLDYVLVHQHITEVNDAMLKQYSSTREKFLGRTASDFLAHDLAQGREFRRRLFDAGRLHIETEERKDDGTPLWIEGDYVCMYDDGGRITGMFGIQRDISERKRAEEALRESEERLRLVTLATHDAVYDWDLRSGRVYRNDAYQALYSPSDPVGTDETWWEKQMHPDDRKRILESISVAFQGKNQTWSGEYRFMRHDGTYASVIDRGYIVYDAQGQAIRMIGAIVDFTERKNAEERVKTQLERLASLRAIDTAISTSTDLRMTFYILLTQAMTRLKVDAAAILLYDPVTNAFEYGGAQGFRTVAIQKAHIRMGEGIAGQAAYKRTTIEGHFLSNEELASAAPLLVDEGFTCYCALPLTSKGKITAVLEIFERQHQKHDRDWVDFLNSLAGQAAIAIENASLFSNLQRSNNDIRHAYEATLEGWSRALDLRDKETEGHTRRVTKLTERIAEAMGIGGEELLDMRRGALLHDIGKMGVPDRILRKRGPLTKKEWEAMRKHPEFAVDLLSPIAYLSRAITIPQYHHEKWDGSGYPRQLKGEQIPLAARIFAVADVYDALTSDRPYRKGWTREQTLEHIRDQAGVHFDPRVAEVFLQVMQTEDVNSI